MSWFDSKKEKKPEKKSMLDKIIMGAIIGTAVGSVIGLAVAPKKEKSKEEFEENKAELEEVGKLTKETVFGIGRLLKHLILRKKTTQSPGRAPAAKPVAKPIEKSIQEHRAGLKEVPKETLSEIHASTLDEIE